MIDKIKKILSGFTEYPIENMGEESDLTTDLGLDSFDVINVTVAFEEEFNIEIPDRHIKDLTTIGKIEKYLQQMEVE